MFVALSFFEIREDLIVSLASVYLLNRGANYLSDPIISLNATAFDEPVIYGLQALKCCLFSPIRGVFSSQHRRNVMVHAQLRAMHPTLRSCCLDLAVLTYTFAALFFVKVRCQS